jgi:hypothetical protein
MRRITMFLVVGLLIGTLAYADVPRLINFQGRLTDAAGKYVSDGSYSVTFSIYSVPSGGSALWTETQSVTVTKGLFNVILGSVTPIPNSIFDSYVDTYLGILVEADAEMTPRQRLSSLGYAYYSLNSDKLDGLHASDFTSPVSDFGRSGVASDLYEGSSTLTSKYVNVAGPDSVMASSGSAFTGKAVGSSSSRMHGVKGYADNSGSERAYGGYFIADSSGTGSLHYGMTAVGYGSSQTNFAHGAHGEAISNSSGHASGVYGMAWNYSSGLAYGGYFYAANNGTGKHYGVYASGDGNSDSISYGAYSYARNSSTGDAYGGYFTTSSSGTGEHYGVYGDAYGSSSSYVYGSYGIAENSSNGNSYGGYFQADSAGTGNKYGLYSRGYGNTSSDTWGIMSYAKNSSSGWIYGGYFSNSSTGTGAHFGTYSTSYGSSSSVTYGSYNYAQNTSDGSAYAGYFSTSSSGTGKHYGVRAVGYGSSDSTTYGLSSYGSNSSIGSVYSGYFETSTSGTGPHYGIYTESNGSGSNYVYGNYAYAENTSTGTVYAGVFWASSAGTGKKYGVYGYAPTSEGYAGYFGGDVRITDSLVVLGSKSAAVKTDNGDYRLLYSMESPENWFEDFGEGKLVNGKAVIQMDPLFTQTVNTSVKYHVFLTPQDEPLTLAVANRTASSFEVRGPAGSDISFSYRIVAKRKGYENLRLAKMGGPTPEEMEIEQARMLAEKEKEQAGKKQEGIEREEEELKLRQKPIEIESVQKVRREEPRPEDIEKISAETESEK